MFISKLNNVDKTKYFHTSEQINNCSLCIYKSFINILVLYLELRSNTIN